jgi:hypothetical protein
MKNLEKAEKKYSLDKFLSVWYNLSVQIEDIFHVFSLLLMNLQDSTSTFESPPQSGQFHTVIRAAHIRINFSARLEGQATGIDLWECATSGRGDHQLCDTAWAFSRLHPRAERSGCTATPRPCSMSSQRAWASSQEVVPTICWSFRCQRQLTFDPYRQLKGDPP